MLLIEENVNREAHHQAFTESSLRIGGCVLLGRGLVGKKSEVAGTWNSGY